MTKDRYWHGPRSTDSSRNNLQFCKEEITILHSKWGLFDNFRGKQDRVAFRSHNLAVSIALLDKIKFLLSHRLGFAY